MKKIVMLFILLICAVSLNAQDEVKNVKEIFPTIYENIKTNAINKWKNDYNQIEYTIFQQCYSFWEFINFKTNTVDNKYGNDKYKLIPDKVYWNIFKESIIKLSGNKSTDCLLYFDVNGKILQGQGTKLYACLNPDWEMVIYEIKNQLDSYLSLNN